MRYELNPKCDFSELPAFRERCVEVFRPYAARGAWDDVAGLAFYSGYPQGMLPVTCAIQRLGGLAPALADETVCKWLVCCQRGVLTVCAALGEVSPVGCMTSLLSDFGSLFPALAGNSLVQDRLDRAFLEWKGLMDTVNVWICAHGGDSYTIRSQVSSRCLRMLYKLEKQYGGKGFGAAVAGCAATGYRVLLDRVFWPAWHKHEERAAALSAYSDAGFSTKLKIT